MVRFFDGLIFVVGLLSGFRSLLSSLWVVLRPYPESRRRLVGLSMDVVDFHFGNCVESLVRCFSAVIIDEILWASVNFCSGFGVGMNFVILKSTGGWLGVLNWFGFFIMCSVNDLSIGFLGGGWPWLIWGVICRLQIPPATENPALPDSCSTGTSSGLVLDFS